MQNGRTNIWVYTGVLAYLKILADALHFNQIIQLLLIKLTTNRSTNCATTTARPTKNILTCPSTWEGNRR